MQYGHFFTLFFLLAAVPVRLLRAGLSLIVKNRLTDKGNIKPGQGLNSTSISCCGISGTEPVELQPGIALFVILPVLAGALPDNRDVLPDSHSVLSILSVLIARMQQQNGRYPLMVCRTGSTLNSYRGINHSNTDLLPRVAYGVTRGSMINRTFHAIPQVMAGAAMAVRFNQAMAEEIFSSRRGGKAKTVLYVVCQVWRCLPAAIRCSGSFTQRIIT